MPPASGYPRPLGYPSPPLVLFSPNGNFLISISEDGMIKLMSVANQGSLLRTFEGAPATSITFSSDSKFLSWGREDGTVELYNIADKVLTVT
jgi:WD40 repeat protein